MKKIKEWKKIVWLSLYDNYEDYNYKGYNNVKPLFDKRTISLPLANNIQIEIKTEDLDFLSMEYIDGWRIVSDVYEPNTIARHENAIYNSKAFEELRSFILSFYSDLTDELSGFIYYAETEDIYFNNDTIKDFINNYLNERFN